MQRTPIHKSWLWTSILILYTWLTGSVSLYADDGLILKDVNLAPGKTTQVAIQLNNSETYTAFQLDITLPEGVTLVQTQDSQGFKLSSRATATHSLTFSTLSDGAMRVLVFSSDNQPFTGQSGNILLMSLAVDEGFIGPKDIEITNIRFTTSSIKEVKFQDVTAKCNLQTYILGDVNGDGSISVTDVGMTISFILGQNPVGFNEDAADLNGDGTISVTDVGALITKILTGN